MGLGVNVWVGLGLESWSGAWGLVLCFFFFFSVFLGRFLELVVIPLCLFIRLWVFLRFLC